MNELQRLLEDFQKQLLSAQILTESLADLLIAKGIMSKEEIEVYCNDKIDNIKTELEKIEQQKFEQTMKSLSKQKKSKSNKKDDADVKITSMFMGNQIGEA